MAIAVQTNAVRYIDVAANDVINVNMPLDAEEHVHVLYGSASLEAVRGVDYTVTLLPESFDSFSITVLASLANKINALIAANPNEENAITIRRRLPLTTESTPSNVRYTKFTADEFDRIIMMMQQIQEQLDRAVQQPPINVGEAGESIFVYPGNAGALAQYNADGDVVPGPQVNDVVTVAGLATEIAALGPVAVQIATLADYTAELVVLGSRGAVLDTLAVRGAIMDTLAAISVEIDALYDVRASIASLGPQAAAIAALDAIKAQIVSLETIKANVTTVAGISANVTTVAGVANAVSTLAGMSAQLTALYNIHAAMSTINTNINSVTAVGGSIANVNLVAGSIANVNAVAAVDDDIAAVAANLALIQQAVNALPHLSAKVSKKGDNMTGNLVLSKAAGNDIMINFALTGTAHAAAMGLQSTGNFTFAANTPSVTFGTTKADGTLSLIAGGQSRVYITAAGNVGIGHGAPGYKLQVEGKIHAQPGNDTNPALRGFAVVNTDGSFGKWVWEEPQLALYINGTRAGWTPQLSDVSLKKNIKDTTQDALTLIRQLRFRAFDWKEGTILENAPSVPCGLVAQEVEEVAPHLVNGGGDNVKGLNINDIVFTLGLAIQQLAARIEALENK